MGQVTLSVNGRDYNIACEDGEEERIKRLGAYVDDRISELIENVGNVGDLRLMVMASLVLCDKLFDAGAEIDRLGASAAKVKKATAPEPDAAVAPVIEAIARRIEDIADHLESA
jgi:cell division protein ZapA